MDYYRDRFYLFDNNEVFEANQSESILKAVSYTHLDVYKRQLVIRGVPHLCVAAEKECLMFLQFTEEGAPIQYVVAHHPMLYKGEMVWSNGDYFPFLNYTGSVTPMADAIRDAGFAMGSDTVYAAMADDELGTRCVGVFTEDISARTALEMCIRDSLNFSVRTRLSKNVSTWYPLPPLREI